MPGTKGKSGVYPRTKSHGEAISKGKMGTVMSEETKKKISATVTGRKFTESHIQKLREASTGFTQSKSRHWLGEKVGPIGIHIWLRKNFGKPNYCEHCKRTDQKNYDWASLDHKYVRRRDAFMRLCRSCHRKYDIKYNYPKKIKVANLLK